VKFATERFPLAIYLHASGSLSFLHCECASGHKVRFVFFDPEDRANALELAFERGAPVPANALFASQKFLRRTMSEVLNNRKTGENFAYECNS